MGSTALEDEEGGFGVDPSFLFKLVDTAPVATQCRKWLDLRKHLVVLLFGNLCDGFLQYHSDGINDDVDLAKVAKDILE